MAVVLITGCSSGFGLMSAVELAKQGDHVFATMRNVAKSDALERAASDAGVALEVGPLDVRDQASVDLCVQHVLQTAGRLDVLVNNAGIGTLAAVEDYAIEEIQHVFETNFLGAVRMMKAVLPAMRNQGSGVIVTVSSISGRVSAPYFGVYAASKYALEAASEAMAMELQPLGIRVAIVEPGRFNTGIMGNEFEPRAFNALSAYWERADRMKSKFGREVERAPDGQAVAVAIADAAHATADEDWRLRRVVGEDAELIMTTRSSMNDEDYGALIRSLYKI